jgi:hypothetical protein
MEGKANAVAKEIGAHMFISTSVMMKLEEGNVPRLFDEAVRAAMYVD